MKILKTKLLSTISTSSRQEIPLKGHISDDESSIIFRFNTEVVQMIQPEGFYHFKEIGLKSDIKDLKIIHCKEQFYFLILTCFGELILYDPCSNSLNWLTGNLAGPSEMTSTLVSMDSLRLDYNSKEIVLIVLNFENGEVMTGILDLQRPTNPFSHEKKWKCGVVGQVALHPLSLTGALAAGNFLYLSVKSEMQSSNQKKLVMFKYCLHNHTLQPLGSPNVAERVESVDLVYLEDTLFAIVGQSGTKHSMTMFLLEAEKSWKLGSVVHGSNEGRVSHLKVSGTFISSIWTSGSASELRTFKILQKELVPVHRVPIDAQSLDIHFACPHSTLMLILYPGKLVHVSLSDAPFGKLSLQMPLPNPAEWLIDSASLPSTTLDQLEVSRKKMNRLCIDRLMDLCGVSGMITL